MYISLLLSISIDMKFSCKAVQKTWSTGGIGSLSLFSLSYIVALATGWARGARVFRLARQSIQARLARQHIATQRPKYLPPSGHF